MHRSILIGLAAVALAAGLGACSRAPAQRSAQPVARPAAASGPASPAGTAAHGRHHSAHRAARLRVLTEPRAGIGPIRRLISRAHRSVDLTMYELRDRRAEADLARDAARGVRVRVILDQHLEKSRNRAAYRYLAARRVHVVWGPAGTTYHQKTLTLDNTTSVIMTLNLVTADYPGTRDFAVIDRKRADIAAIVTTFNADYAGRAINPPHGADLVWSPTNAEASILSVINGATRTLAVENEEMGDPAVTGALARAARRGVKVHLTMTADSEWDPAFRELTRAGVHVRLYRDESGVLYIHAKAIVADAAGPASGCWSAPRTSPSPASATTGSSASSPATGRWWPPSARRWPATMPVLLPTPRQPRPGRPGRKRPGPSARPPPASTAPRTTRTTSTCTPTSPTAARPRPPAAIRTAIRPTAPDTR